MTQSAEIDAVLREIGMCSFREDVNDASMCLCGLPALYHDSLARRIVLADHPATAALIAHIERCTCPIPPEASEREAGK